MFVRDRYQVRIPTDSNVIDLFHGEWNLLQIDLFEAVGAVNHFLYPQPIT